MAVKGNQKTLFNQVKQNIASSEPIDTFVKQEKNKGRTEKREALIYNKTSGFDPEWVGINTLIKMISSGVRKGKTYEDTYYLISSLTSSDAELYAKAIRAHWGIENGLHYVKDVNMNEDNSGIKGGAAAENLSLFKNMAINIYRSNGMKSLKYAVQRFTNKIKLQIDLIVNTNIHKK